MLKGKSKEFYLLAVFMLLQQVVLWIVQLFPKFMPEWKGRYLIQETFLALYALVLLITGVLQVADRLQSKEKFKISFGAVQWLLIIMAVISVLATIFSLDPTASLAGRDKRYEGLYSFAGYYLLCACATRVKDKEERRILYKLMLYIGVFCAIIGILSGLCVFDWATDRWKGVAAIPYGNQNFYGSMISMVDGAALGLAIYGREKKERVTGYVLFAITVAATFSCDSSSPLVANIMVFLIIIFAEVCIRISTKDKGRFRRNLLRFLTGLTIYVLVAVAVNAARGGSVQEEISHDVYYADEGLTSDKMFSNRMIAWKWSFKVLPDYWMLGAGPDNFTLITNRPDAPEALHSYDRAHNEYINLMMTQGVFAVAAYVAFLLTLFIPALGRWIKRKNGQAELLMFLAFFGYIAQAFFNIATIQFMPYFWIVCGMMSLESKQEFTEFV